MFQDSQRKYTVIGSCTVDFAQHTLLALKATCEGQETYFVSLEDFIHAVHGQYSKVVKLMKGIPHVFTDGSKHYEFGEVRAIAAWLEACNRKNIDRKLSNMFMIMHKTIEKFIEVSVKVEEGAEVGEMVIYPQEQGRNQEFVATDETQWPKYESSHKELANFGGYEIPILYVDGKPYAGLSRIFKTIHMAAYNQNPNILRKDPMFQGALAKITRPNASASASDSNCIELEKVPAMIQKMYFKKFAQTAGKLPAETLIATIPIWLNGDKEAAKTYPVEETKADNRQTNLWESPSETTQAAVIEQASSVSAQAIVESKVLSGIVTLLHLLENEVYDETTTLTGIRNLLNGSNFAESKVLSGVVTLLHLFDNAVYDEKTTLTGIRNLIRGTKYAA